MNPKNDSVAAQQEQSRSREEESETKPIRPTINSIQTEDHHSLPSSSNHLSTPSSEQYDHHINSASTTISRASSARSTSSVQAVPIKTPSRRPSQTPSQNQTIIIPSPADHFTETLINYNLNSYQFPPIENLSILNPNHSLSPPISSPSLINSPLPSSSSASPMIRNSPSVDAHSILSSISYQLPHSSTSTSASSSTQTQKQTRKTIKDYHIGEVLGEGSYSTVYQAIDKTSKPTSSVEQYAIKVLDKRHIQKEKKTKYVTVERDTLNLLHHHPGCIKLFATFQDEFSLYFVLEYAPNGEILKVIKDYGSLSLDCTMFYAAEILDAVDHMHSRGVIHRDLKPENILLDSQMRIKIADFGSAKILKMEEESTTEAQRSNSFVGTAEYVSPELLLHKTTSKSSDLWAYGCIIFQMLSGTPPFKSRSEYLTFQKITNLDYEFLPDFPSIARDLIEKILLIEPKDRLTLNEIKSHGFFFGFDWNSIWIGDVPKFQTGIVKASGLNSNQVKIEGFLTLPPLPVSVNVSPDLRGNPLEVAERRKENHHRATEEEEEGREMGMNQIEMEHEGRKGGDLKVEKKLGRRKSRLESSLAATKKAWLGGSGSRKTSATGDSSGSDGGPEVGSTWPEVFLPNELMIYSTSSMKDKTKTDSSPKTKEDFKKVKRIQRLFKKTNLAKIRPKKKESKKMNYTLVLTDFPRLLFVSEDLIRSIVKIEIEILFRELPLLEVNDENQDQQIDRNRNRDQNDRNQNDRNQNDRNRNDRNQNDRNRNDRNQNQNDKNQNDKNALDYFLFQEVEVINCKTFEIKTSNEKIFKFEDPNDSAQRWKDEILFAYQTCQIKKSKAK